VSTSIYETGRVMAFAPDLPGHEARLAFLLGNQSPTGSWGRTDGYALVPTLSAVDAMLAEMSRCGLPLADPGGLSQSAGRALAWLRSQSSSNNTLPDMPAIELIVPSLVTSINARLRSMAASEAPLENPLHMSNARLRAIEHAVRRGTGVPQKVLHALEVTGAAARGAIGIGPGFSGSVGASPAATAAWMDRSMAGQGAGAYLRAIIESTGGPLPCALPITTFERAWVVTTLARADLVAQVPQVIIKELAGALLPGGACAGDGLPPDADTTAVALHAVALMGRRPDPDCLSQFDQATHFSTWPGEDGESTSVNAHVIEALGSSLRWAPDPRRSATIAKLAGWLCDRQDIDGYWTDRWHASPFYATAACVLALDQFGPADCAPALRKAVEWVRGSQRSDGSWGRWGGTAEETAYALQALLAPRGPRSPDLTGVVARGLRALRSLRDAAEDPPLWHDKDLYRPDAIVRANLLVANVLAKRFIGAARIRVPRPRPPVELPDTNTSYI
jgi:hypothetical protein